MNNRPLTSKDVKNVESLLKKGLKMVEIADIMNIGKTTVSRIANGEHPFQRSANAAKVCESETQLDRIERKIDLLLNELM